MSVNSIVRLGRRPVGEDTKPRPLKVVLASEDQKDKVLRVSKNLKYKGDGLEKVFMHQDLTPKQRQKRKELVEELKARQESRRAEPDNSKGQNSNEKVSESTKPRIRITDDKNIRSHTRQSRSYNDLRCMYTNVDTSYNKKAEDQWRN